MARTTAQTPAPQLMTYPALEEIKGKTVTDFALTSDPGGAAHQTDVLTLFFADGSELTIDTGSNALNLSLENKGLKPAEFTVSHPCCAYGAAQKAWNGPLKADRLKGGGIRPGGRS
jgi:hypothetical protein